ncbi:hypothetical protein Sjap_006239 [Stephania japonica]|uniref:Uncharacterized protein n=1 Tax=Stephania japonica TaxID=461633 RepID=A0AAP0PML6_9MAGN
MGSEKWNRKRETGFRGRVRKAIKSKCLCSGEELEADEMVPSSESLATRDYSASGYSSRPGESEQRPDNGNIEEAETSLRESGFLNYEEARALLGRLEYQRGNIQAALHVFEGIDIAAVTPKMKLSIAKKSERRKRRSSEDVPPMSIHAVSLLFEAIFLKSKSLQALGRFREAAQSCKVILDTVESTLPDGMPENFGLDCKLQETLNKAVELLPELWKLAGLPQEAILSYRRALLHYWNLDVETTAKIQKEFAIFLLYGGSDACPPNLRSQVEGSFVPRNNIEEAILLLMILLKKLALKRIEWDPSIIDHLTFALAIAGELKGLASKIEELPPGILDRRETYYTLALCYHGAGEDVVALDLLKKLFSNREDSDSLQALLLASKICGENPNFAEEGVCFAQRSVSCLEGDCDQMLSVTNFLLGVSLSAKARSVISDSERSARQLEALKVLETAEKTMTTVDPRVIFLLSLENAEQRKLDVALYYAKQFLKLDAGSNVRGWVLLARILSAQKRFIDAEAIIDGALDQTGRWDQGELLRTKARLQIAQGQLKNALKTYSHLLALLQVQSKSFRVDKRLLKGNDHDKSLELETWHDLAAVYIGLSQWREAEACLSKSKSAFPRSASRWHTTGNSCIFQLATVFVHITVLNLDINMISALADGSKKPTFAQHANIEAPTPDMRPVACGSMVLTTHFVILEYVKPVTSPLLLLFLLWMLVDVCMLYQAKGIHKEALEAFTNALDIDPGHVPSLVSTAVVLKQLGTQSLAVVRSFLTEALRLDRTNSSAWYNLGLLYKDEGAASAVEAAECFEAATLLEESAPIEPFR